MPNEILGMVQISPSLVFRVMTSPNVDSSERRSQTKIGDDVANTSWDTTCQSWRPAAYVSKWFSFSLLVWRNPVDIICINTQAGRISVSNPGFPELDTRFFWGIFYYTKPVLFSTTTPGNVKKPGITVEFKY